MGTSSPALLPRACASAAQDVYFPIARLYRLRNRIAHHEPIHQLDLGGYYRDLLLAVGFIDPEIGVWLTENSRIQIILAERPADN